MSRTLITPSESSLAVKESPFVLIGVIRHEGGLDNIARSSVPRRRAKCSDMGVLTGDVAPYGGRCDFATFTSVFTLFYCDMLSGFIVDSSSPAYLVETATKRGLAIGPRANSSRASARSRSLVDGQTAPHFVKRSVGNQDRLGLRHPAWRSLPYRRPVR